MFSAASLLAVALFGLSPLAARAQVSFASTTPVALGSGFSLPQGVAVDAAGDVFVADFYNNEVKEMVAVNGSIPANPTILVLGSGFNFPLGVAVDAHGDVFVGDSYNNAAKEILAVNGSIPANPTINILGSGFYGPDGVAVDAAGDVFVADTLNNAVKEILAVHGSIPATNPTINILSSDFKSPAGVAVDAAGDVFVADNGTNEVNEIVAVNGTIPAANPTILTVGSGFGLPSGVAVDAAADVFVADFGNNEVKEMVAVNGSIPATNPTINVLGSGFSYPVGVAVDAHGDVFVADEGNNAVKELQTGSVNFGPANVCPAGQATPTPCSQTLTLNYNVAAETAIGSVKILTSGATGLDFQAETNDSSTTLCSAQTYSSATTCTVDVTFAPLAPGERLGVVQIVDGSGNVLASTHIYGTGTGPAIAFSPSNTVALGSGFYRPSGVAMDAAGDVFIADRYNNEVKEIVAVNGSISANPTINILGSGFYHPSAVAVDGAGDVFVADFGNSDVKEILAAGGYTTVLTLGSGFYGPIGVAVDAAGDVFVADVYNNEVKEMVAVNGSIPASPTILTLGSGFNGPMGVAVDAAGDVFVTAYSDVKEILAAGGYTTFLTLGSGFNNPTGVAVDAAGDVFVADENIGEVKEIVAVNGSIPATNPTINILGSGFLDPEGVAVDAAGDVFVADYGHNDVKEMARSKPPSLSFATTNVGSTSSDSPKSVLFQNVGTAPLTGSAVLSDTTDFTVVAGSGTPPDCTLATLSLSAGEECNLSIDYNPQSGGPINANVTLTDNALHAGAPSYATQVINLSGTSPQQSQTITFTGLPTTATYGSAGPYTLNATASSGLAVSYAVTGQASISGTTLTITGAGTVMVTASQAGNAGYAAATPVSQTINVGQASQTITFTGLPTTATYGSAGPYTLNATASSGLTVSYSVTGPASISGNTLAITGAGTVIVTASQAGNTNYAAATPVSQTIIVTAVPVAQATPNPMQFGTIAFGSNETLPLTISNTGSGTLTLNSISISGHGSYSAVMPDTACAAGVAGGSSCVLQIEYSPTKVGEHIDYLTLNTNGGTVVVKLRGFAKGVGATVDYLPFRTIPANQTETLTVTILNYGEPGTPTVSFAIDGPSFKVVPGSGCVTTGVASGQTCTVQIQFVPGIPGLHAHTLTITPSEGTASTVELHGTSTAVP
jgi:sugar lactone lactonase YvrE